MMKKEEDLDDSCEMIIEEERFFKCMCTKSISLTKFETLKNHIQKCNHYQDKSPIHKIFSGIPFDNLHVEQLVAIIAEFDMYTNSLKQVISNRDDPLVSQMYPQKVRPSDQIDVGSLYHPRKEEDHQIVDPRAQQGDLVICQNNKCNKKFYSFDMENIWYLYACCHLVCRSCLIKTINNNYVQNEGQVKCLVAGCDQNMIDNEIKELVGQKQFEKLEQKYMDKLTGQSTIQCCNSECKERIQFLEGQVDFKQKNEAGATISKEAAIHYAQNRFSCPTCKTEQCRSCKSIPYHKGYTCEQYKQKCASKNCRYCGETIQKTNTNAPANMQDICLEDECQQKMQNACTKVLQCGHPCYGFKDEARCLECKHPDCDSSDSQQKGDDYCNICFIEGLENAPIVKLQCGHIFHYHCIKKRLEIKWFRPRITFNFCMCPLCKVWMGFPIETIFAKQMKENLALYEEIKKMSLERLKYEQRDKDERLSRVGDPYYQKPLEYSLAIYSYYMCYKCKKPYFGGLKSCEAGQEERAEFNPQELVCANCCDIIPIESCKKHGKTFIEFKCRYCCSIAQWFCWGNTHFCEPCHKRQCSGDYVSKYSKDKLPQCKGKDYCPLRVDHPRNGEEYALGCALCRNEKANSKKF